MRIPKTQLNPPCKLNIIIYFPTCHQFDIRLFVLIENALDLRSISIYSHHVFETSVLFNLFERGETMVKSVWHCEPQIWPDRY